MTLHISQLVTEGRKKKKDVTFESVTKDLDKRGKCRAFVDMLVLHKRGMVHMEQRKAFDTIHVSTGRQ